MPISLLTVVEILLVIIVLCIVLVIVSENRKSERTLAWILALVFLPVIGVLLYLVFGQEHKKKYNIMKKFYKGLSSKYFPSLHIESSEIYPAEYQKLVSMFENLNDAPVLSGNEIALYPHARNKFDRLFDDIEKAVHHVHLLYYKMQDDKIGNELKDLLIKKVKQGVEVRVIYDDVGSIKTRKRYFKEMKKGGIEVEAFLEVKLPWIAQRVNYRNHRKIAIIDGRIGYTGGMNVGDCYIDGVSWGEWKDLQIRIEGNGVKGLQKVFFLDWYYSHKSTPQLDLYFPQLPDNGETPLQIVSSGPVDIYNTIEKGILQAISSARKSIYIQTPYFMPSDSILTTLQAASASDVEVHIMLPEKSDNYFVDRTTYSYIKDLLEYDINVYLFRGGFLHSKSIVVDDSLASIGSANMDTRSFELSFETNAFIYDQTVALQTKDIFFDDVRNSVKVEKDNWDNRPAGRRFMESVMRLFTPIF